MKIVKSVTLISFTGLVGLMFCGSAFAADDYVDYDHDVDFNTFKTFQMADTSKGALAQANQIMNDRVEKMVEEHFVALGLKEVDENPDLIVTYDASTKENHVLNTVGAPMGPIGIGFGARWGRFGALGMGGMATTTVSTFTEGTLVIDAYIPSTKKMVWRGTAEAAVSDNPEKTTEHIKKSLDKLFKNWEKIRDGAKE